MRQGITSSHRTDLADSYPYISGAGNLVQAITHFRKSFPATVTADTLKKLGIAPNNESYVINTLRFIGVLDSESKKTPEATKAFSQHQDGDFNKEFAPLVQSAYKDLFEIHGDRAWTLDKDSLITFFRQSDDTSAVIGGRQANVFLALAGLSGHGELPVAKKAASKATQKRRQVRRSNRMLIGNQAFVQGDQRFCGQEGARRGSHCAY